MASDVTREADMVGADMIDDTLGAPLITADRFCANCGSPATCIGRYETMSHWELACDECCGHGCEDGKCYQLVQVPHLLESYARIRAEARRAAIRECVELLNAAAREAPHVPGYYLHNAADRLRALLEKGD